MLRCMVVCFLKAWLSSILPANVFLHIEVKETETVPCYLCIFRHKSERRRLRKKLKQNIYKLSNTFWILFWLVRPYFSPNNNELLRLVLDCTMLLSYILPGVFCSSLSKSGATSAVLHLDHNWLFNESGKRWEQFTSIGSVWWNVHNQRQQMFLSERGRHLL